MNQPGLSYEALGEVQIWNLNCIFEALLISEMDDILTLSFTQPLWLGDANTGTAPLGAPLGDGASLDIVLVYPPPEAVLSGAMYVQSFQVPVLILYSIQAPSPPPEAGLSK